MEKKVLSKLAMSALWAFILTVLIFMVSNADEQLPLSTYSILLVLITYFEWKFETLNDTIKRH